jgi:hypothetical protein
MAPWRTAVLDFGSSGVGDPACDVVIAWTFLCGASRDRFRAELGVDPVTRAPIWAACVIGFLAKHIRDVYYPGYE